MVGDDQSQYALLTPTGKAVTATTTAGFPCTDPTHAHFPFTVKDIDLDLHRVAYADFCSPELVIEDGIDFRPPAQEGVAHSVVQCRALHNVHTVDVTGRSRGSGARGAGAGTGACESTARRVQGTEVMRVDGRTGACCRHGWVVRADGRTGARRGSRGYG